MLIRGQIISLAIIAAASSGCNNMRVPADDTARASFNPNYLASSTAPIGASIEEPSAEVRALILSKVRNHLMKVGEFPTLSMQNAELLSLTPTFTNMAPQDATWSYQAVVRMNLTGSSVKQTFLVFDRDGNFIVRKISI
jgi:hypothetical protein